MKKKRVVYVSAVLVLIAGVLLVPLVPVWEEAAWSCARTGSRKGCTVWLGLVTSGKWEQASPLEDWLVARGREVEHDWVKTMGTRHGLLGVLSRSHEQAPVLLGFRPEQQKVFLATASEAEILALLETIRSGSRAEVQKAVGEVADRLLDKDDAGK